MRKFNLLLLTFAFSLFLQQLQFDAYLTSMPKRDESQEALRQVQKITESKLSRFGPVALAASFFWEAESASELAAGHAGL